MNGMIGLSLSFCVADICRGKVNLEQVEKIVTGTMAGPNEWDDLLAEYKKIYWQEFPKKAEAIAQQLMKEGKIDQPRLRGEEARNIPDGHWLVNGVPTRI